jgi:hypothetical protein
MRREIGEKGYQFLQRHQGATERVFQEILPFLSKTLNENSSGSEG